MTRPSTAVRTGLRTLASRRDGLGRGDQLERLDVSLVVEEALGLDRGGIRQQPQSAIVVDARHGHAGLVRQFGHSQ